MGWFEAPFTLGDKLGRLIGADQGQVVISGGAPSATIGTVHTGETCGEVSLLLCGDITSRAEKELVAREGDRLKSTVLFVPHHGSESSSTTGFIDAVKPQIGIVSAGWQNRYHFPHPAVLKRYRQSKTRLLRTDQDGAISLATDGFRLSIDTATADRE